MSEKQAKQYKVVNKHPEWEGENRHWKWYVNEIQNLKDKKVTWCSDHFLEDYSEIIAT